MKPSRHVLPLAAALVLYALPACADGELRVRIDLAEPVVRIEKWQAGPMRLACTSNSRLQVVRSISFTTNAESSAKAEGAVTCDRRSVTTTSASDRKSKDEPRSVDVVVAEIEANSLPKGFYVHFPEPRDCQIVRSNGLALEAAEAAALVFWSHAEALLKDSGLNLKEKKK